MQRTAARIPAALGGETFDGMGSPGSQLSNSTWIFAVAFFGKAFANVYRRSRWAFEIYSPRECKRENRSREP